MIRHISFKDKSSQPFITAYSTLTSDFSYCIQNILSDRTPSLVGTTEGEHPTIIKLIRARTWHEYLKMLWMHSRVSKEVNGNTVLKDLDLNVPEILEVGYGLLPTRNYEFIGYYIMEDLTNAGYREVSDLIRSGDFVQEQRTVIMRKIFDGLKTMRDNYIVFSDFHLDNIFSDKHGNIKWIDTGVSLYTGIRKNKFIKKHNHAINRFIHYYDKTELLMSESEKSHFRDLLIQP